jgi:hypothetical protein
MGEPWRSPVYRHGPVAAPGRDTVTATASMAGLNLLTYLAAYPGECGRTSGKPLAGPALERFLPWNASPEDCRDRARSPPPG